MGKKELIESLRKQGFSPEVVKAFEKVQREDFVPENLKGAAYEDEALPLEKGATISQPYTIAFMLDKLELGKGQKILEIGSGCGYVLALLAEITKGEICGVEIIESLAEKSKKALLRYENVKVVIGNGFDGLKEKAPFDRILISADAGRLPEHLFEQLKDGGILVGPVGDSIIQVRKEKGKIKINKFYGFVFVPLRNFN